ncbi:MAG: hypothetical protein N2747_02615 [Chitinophagaceae bacterium]|nr:hypothetical protein [Chitinophagaceae bacterium]
MSVRRYMAIFLGLEILLSSCGIMSQLFKRKTGCPTNGKNIGAERILSGDPEAMKAVKKAKKFKS